ncbi:MAG: hypothetical protein Q9183_007461, partial [Haloplaca sp. 2 TL-2023]
QHTPSWLAKHSEEERKEIEATRIRLEPGLLKAERRDKLRLGPENPEKPNSVPRHRQMPASSVKSALHRPEAASDSEDDSTSFEV